MDAGNFDTLTRSLSRRPTRRAALRLLAAGLLGGLLSRHGTGLAHAAQRPDRDGDGLYDDDEVDVYGTNPDVFDTDGDGVGDGEEVYVGTDPLAGGVVDQAPAVCAQTGQSCAAAECCLGYCTQDEICECVDNGFTCAGVANGGCCTGSCNADGFCGSCTTLGAPCNADAECCRGTYAALCCFSGVSLTTVCTDVTNIGFVCPGDAPPVECPAGLIDCGGYCADIEIDLDNCGGCGVVCGGGGGCFGGECVPPPRSSPCSARQTECGDGVCVDLTSHAAHCGACFNSCPLGGFCQSGFCRS